MPIHELAQRNGERAGKPGSLHRSVDRRGTQMPVRFIGVMAPPLPDPPGEAERGTWPGADQDRGENRDRLHGAGLTPTGPRQRHDTHEGPVPVPA